MRISDWSSDVCSSDLYFTFFGAKCGLFKCRDHHAAAEGTQFAPVYFAAFVCAELDCQCGEAISLFNEPLDGVCFSGCLVCTAFNSRVQPYVAGFHRIGTNQRRRARTSTRLTSK